MLLQKLSIFFLSMRTRPPLPFLVHADWVKGMIAIQNMHKDGQLVDTGS